MFQTLLVSRLCCSREEPTSKLIKLVAPPGASGPGSDKGPCFWCHIEELFA